MPSPTLTSLPVELLLPIATLLPVRSVIHLLSTSSLLRRILTYPHLWTTLDYSEFGSTLGDAKLETSLRWIERSTHLEHAHRSPPLHRVRAIILDGTFIAGRTLLSCLDRFPELRYLSVRGTARDALDWFFAEIWKQSPHATSKLAHFDMSDPTNHNQFSPRAYASFRAIAFSQFPALVIFLPRICSTCGAELVALDTAAILSRVRGDVGSDLAVRCVSCIHRFACVDCRAYSPHTPTPTSPTPHPLVLRKCMQCPSARFGNRCRLCDEGWVKCTNSECDERACPACVEMGKCQCTWCEKGPLCRRHRPLCLEMH